MRAIFLFACFLLCAFCALAQDEEPRYVFSGRVYDVDSITPLPTTYLIIKKTSGGALSDAQGRFKLYLKRSDTVVVSYTGLKTLQIAMAPLVDSLKSGSNIYMRIYMQRMVVKLRSALVTALRPSPSKVSDKEFYEGMIKSYTVKPSVGFAPSGGIVFNGALSALLMPFTHKGREMSKFEQMYIRMETEKVVNKRFNEDLVHEVTGMDYKDIPDFKKYCGFSNEFVLSSKDYDFILAIRKAYERYLYSRWGIRPQQR